MRELSLFSGAGGGLLGTKLLGFKHVGYVEWDDYCQRVLAQRIADGYLDRAPIFGDVREFAQSGAADQYRGIADVVSAGFPCQPFSVAGKQLAADDSRNMWPATAEVIRRVEPKHVLLENVPGLVSCGYIGTVFTDLAALGFVFRWGVLGACDAGAPHRRDRLWIVAHAARECGDVCADHRERDSEHVQAIPESGNGGNGADVADADRGGPQGPWWSVDPGNPEASGDREVHRAFDGSRWGIESALGRVAHGVANRVDRLKAIGNGQVPGVVELAWRTLA